MHSHTQKKENWLCSFPTVILHIHKAEITLQSSTCSHLTLEDSHTHSLNHSHTYTLTNSNTHGHTLTRTRANILTNFETLKHTHKDFLSIKQSQSHILSHTHTHILTVGSYPHTLSHTFYLFYTYLHTLSDTFWSDFLWCPAGDGLVWNGLISVSASSCLKWVIFSSPPAHHKHKTITAHVREAALRDQTPEPSGTTEPPSRS